jgi:hypothetical protein
MALTIKVHYHWWPLSISRASATFISSLGERYECRCHRSLEFDVWDQERLVVSGQRHGRGWGRGNYITVTQGDRLVGTIRMLSPIGDRLALGETSYPLPMVLRPGIPALGLRFSRLGLVYLSRPTVHVYDEAHLTIALALLAYFHARGVFVEGG